MVCAVPVLPAMSRPGMRAATPVPPSLTTAHRDWRRSAHTIGESSTWPLTLPASLHTTPFSGRSMRWTSRGFHRTPPLAMALMKRATCIGVTSTAPWPMDMFTVSPACQMVGRPLRGTLGCGISPGFSPPKSIPVGAPSPKASAHFAIAGAPILRPAV